MTERLSVTRAQAQTMAKIAVENGCIVEVERDGVIYRVIPEDLARDERRSADVDTPRRITL